MYCGVCLSEKLQYGLGGVPTNRAFLYQQGDYTAEFELQLRATSEIEAEVRTRHPNGSNASDDEKQADPDDRTAGFHKVDVRTWLDEFHDVLPHPKSFDAKAADDPIEADFGAEDACKE